MLNFHAEYNFDPDEKPKESLLIMPRGWGGERSPVDLSGAAPHHCKAELEVQNRCIMLAASPVAYPANASGAITLTATVGRDGGVKGIRAAETHVTPDKATDFLVEAARQDLSTWHLDAADHDDPLRVTYSFVMDPSLRRGDGTFIRWNPPDHVEVRTNSPE